MIDEVRLIKSPDGPICVDGIWLVFFTTNFDLTARQQQAIRQFAAPYETVRSDPSTTRRSFTVEFKPIVNRRFESGAESHCALTANNIRGMLADFIKREQKARLAAEAAAAKRVEDGRDAVRRRSRPAAARYNPQGGGR